MQQRVIQGCPGGWPAMPICLPAPMHICCLPNACCIPLAPPRRCGWFAAAASTAAPKGAHSPSLPSSTLLVQSKLNIPPITQVVAPVVNVVNSAKKKLKKFFG